MHAKIFKKVWRTLNHLLQLRYTKNWLQVIFNLISFKKEKTHLMLMLEIEYWYHILKYSSLYEKKNKAEDHLKIKMCLLQMFSCKTTNQQWVQTRLVQASLLMDLLLDLLNQVKIKEFYLQHELHVISRLQGFIASQMAKKKGLYFEYRRRLINVCTYYELLF